MINELQTVTDNAVIDTTDSPVQSLAKMAASGVGLDVIEQMKSLVEWDDARRAKTEFNTAFSKAKRAFKKARKSGWNAHLKSNYSTLEDYDDATREALSEHGLSWRHVVSTPEAETTSVMCVLAHESGHSETTDMQAPSYSMTNNAVNKLQSVGIVATYLKRMTLGSSLGIVSDSEFDNDGNGGKSTETITAEQAVDLQSLADEVKADKKKFFNWLSNSTGARITEFKDIPAAQHDKALKALEGKRK